MRLFNWLGSVEQSAGVAQVCEAVACAVDLRPGRTARGGEVAVESQHDGRRQAFEPERAVVECLRQCIPAKGRSEARSALR